MMFKTLCYCFLLLFFKTLSAQEPAQAPVRRFQIGINYSADYAFRTLVNKDKTMYVGLLRNERIDAESPKYGQTGGLNALYSPNRHWEIGLGVQLSSKGYNISGFWLPYAISYQNSASKSKMVQHFYYLDVPVKANFVYGKGKWRGLAGVGLVMNFLTAANLEGVSDVMGNDIATKRQNKYEFSSFNFSAMVSAGVDYQLHERLRVRLEPTFRCNLLPIDEFPSMYLWDVGLNASCYFAL